MQPQLTTCMSGSLSISQTCSRLHKEFTKTSAFGQNLSLGKCQQGQQGQWLQWPCNCKLCQWSGWKKWAPLFHQWTVRSLSHGNIVHLHFCPHITPSTGFATQPNATVWISTTSSSFQLFHHTGSWHQQHDCCRTLEILPNPAYLWPAELHQDGGDLF